MEHRFGQLVRLVEHQQGRVHLDDIIQNKSPHLTDIIPFSPDPDRAGYLADKVTFLHVLGAENIENLLMLMKVNTGGGTLATTGLTSHPCDIAPALRIGEHSRDLLVSASLHDLPTGSAYTTDLRGDITEHLVTDILITPVQDIAHSTHTDSLQTTRGLRLARILRHVSPEALTDGVLLFHCNFHNQYFYLVINLFLIISRPPCGCSLPSSQSCPMSRC